MTEIGTTDTGDVTELEHAVRGQLAIVLGEVELVLADAATSAAERAGSRDRVVTAVRAIEAAFTARRGEGAGS